MSDDWVLAIDFGTTSTAAAIRVDDRVQLVAIEGSPRMPSAIFWREGTGGAGGELVLGRRVENLASRAPWCLERTPKRRIGDDHVQLGDQRVRVVDAIGEIFRKVAGEATRLRGGQRPAEVRLTHPARWGEVRLAKLREAAAEAGFAEPVLIPEPVAAAVYFASARLEPDQHVAVYDLGGGTFDTAVLRRTPDGAFAVAGQPGGSEDLGGEDFDDLLYRHLGQQLPPDQWRTLRRSATNRETAGNAWREANVALQREARLAKEVLSESADYEVRIPVPVDAYLPVLAGELDELIRPDLEQTVVELERTIASAGLEPSDLAAIYLAGGSSRIPLVSELIRDRLGQSPDYLDDPKSVIALGAARAPLGAYAPARRSADEAPPAPAPARPQPPPQAPAPPEPPPHATGGERPPPFVVPAPPPAARPEPAPPRPQPLPASATIRRDPSAQTSPRAARRQARRIPIPLIMAAIAAAIAIVAIIVGTAGGGGGGGSTRRAAELDALSRMQSILAVAGQGRGLIVAGDFNGAIANRRAVLRLLDGLGQVPPDLVPSVGALRAAEQASLEADNSLRLCGPPCSQSINATATQLKRRFVALYDPIATSYGAQTFSPDEI